MSLYCRIFSFFDLYLEWSRTPVGMDGLMVEKRVLFAYIFISIHISS